MAADAIHNFLAPTDVNNDDSLSAGDALLIINRLSESHTGDASASSPDAVDATIRDIFCDVDDNQQNSPRDALLVINELARSGLKQDASETVATDSDVRVRIELEVQSDREIEFQIRAVGLPPSSTHDVSVDGEVLGQINADHLGRGKLELKYKAGQADLPAVLVNATATTPFAIGDLVTGTLGAVGELNDDHSHSGSGDDDPSHDQDDDHGDDSSSHGSDHSDDRSDDLDDDDSDDRDSSDDHDSDEDESEDEEDDHDDDDDDDHRHGMEHDLNDDRLDRRRHS